MIIRLVPTLPPGSSNLPGNLGEAGHFVPCGYPHGLFPYSVLLRVEIASFHVNARISTDFVLMSTDYILSAKLKKSVLIRIL